MADCKGPDAGRRGRLLRPFAAALAAAAAGCASTGDEPAAVRVDEAGAAEIVTAAPRAVAYEAVIREIRRRGVVQVSSLEGGWVHGQIGASTVRVELRDAGAGTLVRVLPYTADAAPGLPYSRYTDESPNIELARIIADAATP